MGEEIPVVDEGEYGVMAESEVKLLTDIFGGDWKECVTPEGADRLISIISERRSESPDPIEDGDECPVCNEEIRNVNEVLSGMVGESVSASKICVQEKDEETGEVHSIIHLDDERVDSPDNL